jgi:hypothetical protein
VIKAVTQGALHVNATRELRKLIESDAGPDENFDNGA